MRDRKGAVHFQWQAQAQDPSDLFGHMPQPVCCAVCTAVDRGIKHKPVADKMHLFDARLTEWTAKDPPHTCRSLVTSCVTICCGAWYCVSSVGSPLRSQTRVPPPTSCGPCLLVASCTCAATTGTARHLMQPWHPEGAQQRLCWRRQGQTAQQLAAQRSRLSAHLPSRVWLWPRSLLVRQECRVPGRAADRHRHVGDHQHRVMYTVQLLSTCGRDHLMRHRQQTWQEGWVGQRYMTARHWEAQHSKFGPTHDREPSCTSALCQWVC
jgi:hypothetical protein